MATEHSDWSRRRLIKVGLGTLGLFAVSGCSLLPAVGRRQESGLVYSAVQTVSGGYALVAMHPDGRLASRQALPARFHSGCTQAEGSLTVFFARRPGASFFVVETASGRLLNEIPAVRERHFFGHGTFDSSGRWLYATENDYAGGRGVIGIYDAERAFERVGELDAGGIGPHEVILHPDGKTLVVAVGGIETHPDSGRIKLNLDSMASCLALIDAQTGTILQRFESPHRQLSCRHLDISCEGVVIAGFQYEGPEWDDQPLLARLDTHSRQWQPIQLPLPQQRALKQYIASVAINDRAGSALVTSPRGGKALMLDVASGQVIRILDFPDAAGVVAHGEGFIVSNGIGDVLYVEKASVQDRLLAIDSRQDVRFDNHMLWTRS